VVIADEHRHLNHSLVVIALRESSPGWTRDGVLGMQFVSGTAQLRLEYVPSCGVRTEPDALHVLLTHPDLCGNPVVLRKLVGRSAVAARPQSENLAVARRNPTAQCSSQVDHGGSQLRVADQGGIDVDRRTHDQAIDYLLLARLPGGPRATGESESDVPAPSRRA
jgi:hypothetical protein